MTLRFRHLEDLTMMSLSIIGIFMSYCPVDYQCPWIYCVENNQCPVTCPPKNVICQTDRSLMRLLSLLSTTGKKSLHSLRDAELRGELGNCLCMCIGYSNSRNKTTQNNYVITMKNQLYILCISRKSQFEQHKFDITNMMSYDCKSELKMNESQQNGNISLKKTYITIQLECNKILLVSTFNIYFLPTFDYVKLNKKKPKQTKV